MPRRTWLVSASILLTAGCLGDQKGHTLVPTNPFGTTTITPVSAKMGDDKATVAVSRRVLDVGAKVVKANPQIGLHPVFQTVGSPKPAIFHQLDTNASRVVITEGLVQACPSDAQLAAVLCRELGKMVSERVALGGRLAQARDERPPPLDIGQIGGDLGGRFGPSDATHLAEMGKFEAQRRRAVPTAATPPPPDVLARAYLQNAGYTAADLEAVNPLLRAAEGNSDLEKLMKKTPGM